MKKVIVTVDTEGHVGADPIKHLIYGETADGEQFGIPLIMDICDRYNVKALFFLDFAEAWDYGKDRIIEVARYIKNRGHDVGVHIHPDHMANPQKKFLSQYTYAEQYDIIKQCTDLYNEALGEAPKAFRAGKYGANRETLRILSELGYRADFSEFFGHDNWCHITPPVASVQSGMINYGLIEFPVMSYVNKCWKLFYRHDKLDIIWSSFEHKYLLNRISKETQINVISLFFHSFSSLIWRQCPDNPRLNRRVKRNMELALKHVTSMENMEFASLDELIETDYPQIDNSNLSTFEVHGPVALLFFGHKAYATILSWIQIWWREKKKR